MSQQSQQTQSQHAIKAIDKRYDLNAPFAPGSYIELEIHSSQNQQLQWGFIEVASQTELDSLYKNVFILEKIKQLLTNNKPNATYNVNVFKYDTKEININKIAFTLPINRNNETTPLKSFIVVIVYPKNIIENSKHITHISQICHIKLNTSFCVGIEKDNAIKEIQRDGQSKIQYGKILNSNDINKWNQLEHIYTLAEAVAFLKALPKEAKDDFSNYARQNPQIACKIAYIYYRFDLGNESFIASITNDNGEYVSDRDKYIQYSLEVYDNTINKCKKQFNENFCRTLIKNLLEKFKLPQIDIECYERERGFFGEYDKKNATITLNSSYIKSKTHILDTIFHEIRHYYISEKKIGTANIILRYLRISYDFYIDANDDNIDTIFKQFVKKSTGEQNIYAIQPSEIDAKYVSAQITNSIKYRI